jgi:methyl-accepting chemotaxis protein
LAEKDLTVSVKTSGSDEIGRLSVALNTSVGAMRDVLRSVVRGAEMLSAATTEINARSVQSAENAHTQSDKTSQIAAAAQKMTATIGEISRNAENAADASRKSAETARGAEEAVETLKDLASLASDLDSMIRQFRLE